MDYPVFFDRVEKIVMQDALSDFLGTFEGGIVEFSYVDVVKMAGHSCPTVAGAYLMTYHALKALYGEEITKRGEIKVSFKESEEEGVAGVIAHVISNITGATQKHGFKGLNGKFVRHSLMEFESDHEASAKFTRLDTNESVLCHYNPAIVPADTLMQPLMQKAMQGDMIAQKEFGMLWQKRVERILINHFNDEDILKIERI